MLRALRLRLGLLYLAASLGLVVLLGAATYGLMALDFQRSTDLALQYKMAVEFRVRGLPLPASLASAEQAWTQEGNRQVNPTPTSLPATDLPPTERPATDLPPTSPPATTLPTISPTVTSPPVINDEETSYSEDDSDGDEDASESHNTSAVDEIQPTLVFQSSLTPETIQATQITSHESSDEDDRYDGSLAPVFVVPDEASAPAIGVPSVNDPAAIAHAQQTGSDLRTLQLDNGTRLRLLTYRTDSGGVLQVGRLLSDQDRMLSQYLLGLLILGSAASLVLALASWLMAGRSIKPAQKAWDQQQLFIANASHELRAPLTLMRASADYALRNPDVDERERYLKDIVGEVDYMNSLVEDLLLLSRLDARRLSLADDLVDLKGLLEEIQRHFEMVAKEKGVNVMLEASSGKVRGDPVRLRQVLLILLDNALRFTETGGTIRLSARMRGREVEISVSDNGCGIPPQDLPHMFERFYQVANQPEEGRGNGLGLSIAHSLVEAHRGRISITSLPDQGTSVQILLPAAER